HAPIFATWQNKNEIELINGWASWHQFTQSRLTVRTVTSNAITLNTPAVLLARSGKQDEMPENGGFNSFEGGWVAIENAYELLGTPGQFYLRTSDDTLHYVPRANENLAAPTTQVTIPVLENLITLTSVQNILFDGVVFAETTWLQPMTDIG